MQLWLSPAEAYKPTGYKNVQALYRDIALGIFPFRYVKIGKRIRISARDIGLVTDNNVKEEARGQEVISQVTA